MQGQRFHIDLDDEPQDMRPANVNSIGNIDVGLIADIKERSISTDVKAPSPPRLRSSESGFPTHRVRTGPSKFKSRKGNLNSAREKPSRESNGSGGPPSLGVKTNDEEEYPLSDTKQGVDSSSDPNYQSIDRENKQRLAEMSEQEIEEARQDLLKGLNPSLVERLLKRANINERRSEPNQKLEITPDEVSPLSRKPGDVQKPTNPESLSPKVSSDSVQAPSFDPDGPPAHPPSDLYPAVSYPSSLPQPPEIHFPNPPKPPDLDPADPDFLTNLHSTYFPTLPADPSAMSWMTPLDPNEERYSAYSTQKEDFPPSALRFDFRGHLLPPILSSQIPSTKGLHHHAHAPSSAGYTIPELAHLARSSYAAQRCIAYQTLGRVLYRLGRGDFGCEGEDLCEGLWQLMDQGKVVDQLVEAAAKGDKGNKSVWATATDAVWLWRKGGGRRWKGR